MNNNLTLSKHIFDATLELARIINSEDILRRKALLEFVTSTLEITVPTGDQNQY